MSAQRFRPGSRCLLINHLFNTLNAVELRKILPGKIIKCWPVLDSAQQPSVNTGIPHVIAWKITRKTLLFPAYLLQTHLKTAQNSIFTVFNSWH